jgi:glycosyltransferase involved in cell wall biosynthesis
MTARLKILHVVVAGQIGGAERLLATLATRRGEAGHVIAVMTPNRDLTEFFRVSGAQVHDRGRCRENPLAYLSRSYGPADIAWLARVIAAERAGILHCHTYGSHVLAARAAARCGLPLVRTEHGVRHYRDPTCALNRHWALKHTTKIVAVSGFVGRTVARIEPAVADRIVVVHNGIDLARFEPQPPRSEGPFKIAAAVRLEPVKRLEIAIAALAEVPNVLFDIAGDGADRTKLEALAQRCGVADRVHFLGQLSDPRSVIAGADAVVNTTRQEAMSLAILEAGAMQRPAIAVAQGGTPEAVVDGRTGWLTEDDSVAGFARILRAASADRAEAARRGKEARAWVTAGFGLETMCEGYDAVYRNLLPGEDNGRGS